MFIYNPCSFRLINDPYGLILPSPSVCLTSAYLYGLSEAALAEHFSVDEVRRAEDAVSPTGDHPERLGSVDVLPLRDGRRRVTGARRFVDAVTPPERRRQER